MTLTDDGLQARGEDRTHLYRIISLTRSKHHRQVDLMIEQPLFQHIDDILFYVHMHTGMLAVELCQGINEDGRQTDARTDTDIQIAAFHRTQVGHALPALLRIDQDALGIGQEGTALDRQRHVTAHTMEERHRELCLQLLDLLRQGALHHMGCLSRLREVERTRGQNEIFELTNLHLTLIL